MTKPRLFFRCREIRTNDPWIQLNGQDLPRPPDNYYVPDDGFQTQWQCFLGPSDPLYDASRPETFISATSIVWSQRPGYLVHIGDCTQTPVQKPIWQHLKFHDVSNNDPERQDNLCGICVDGEAMHYDAYSPGYFVLPRRYFKQNGSPRRCRLCARMSLVISLLAMSTRDLDDIPRRVLHHFNDETYPDFDFSGDSAVQSETC